MPIVTSLYEYQAIGYFIEVVIAELLFLYHLNKRKHFYLRLIVSVAVSILVISRFNIDNADKPITKFVLLLLILAISYVCMYFSFDDKTFTVSFLCVDGIATQHIANKTIILLFLIPQISELIEVSLFYRIFAEFIICFISYLVIFAAFASKFSVRKNSFRSNLLSIVIVFTCIGLNRMVVDYEIPNPYSLIASCIYAIICCTFALSIQFYLYKWEEEKAEAMVVKELLSASEKQYEQWKTMVQLNNIHIHDLKHMLNKIEHLSGKEQLEIPDLTPIRDSIDNFSPLVKTGNEVIDVLLRNMDSLCKEQNIRFNCVSYTDQLGRFDNMSLYFLFANAIDNSRAAADKVTDSEKRLIDVSIKEFGDSVIIHIWNYFEGEIVMQDGLPVNSENEEGHGYGLKSIKLLVDKFEGAFKAQPEGDVFHLNIILPMSLQD